MKTIFITLAAIILIAACGQKQNAKATVDLSKVQAEVMAVQDSMHKAFLEKRVDDYMKHFTADARILGTDPSENLSKEGYMEYLKDFIAKGLSVDYTTNNSLIIVSPDGKNAVTNFQWRFPTILKNGDIRICYNWILTDTGWRCNFANYAVIPPNADIPAIDSVLAIKK